MGARMVPANGQTTKTKKIFYICRFGWKDFPSYYKYIHSRAIFVLEKGVVLLLGTVLLLGHIRYAISNISRKKQFWEYFIFFVQKQ